MANFVLVDSDGIAHAVASRVTLRDSLAACGRVGIVSIRAGEATCPKCLAALNPPQPVSRPRFTVEGTMQWLEPKALQYHLPLGEARELLELRQSSGWLRPWKRANNSKPKRKAYRRMPRGNWKKGE